MLFYFVTRTTVATEVCFLIIRYLFSVQCISFSTGRGYFGPRGGAGSGLNAIGREGVT